MAPKIDKVLRSGSAADCQFSLEEVMNKIKLLDSKLDTRFENLERNVEAKFTELLDSKISEAFKTFENKVKDVTSEFIKSIEEVKEDHLGLASRADALEVKVESLERATKSADVILHGIPPVPNEDLKAILSKIFQEVKYHYDTYTTAFRLRNENKKTPAIIVKFPTAYCQKQFIRAVKKTKPKLCDIGFVGSTGVFAYESLTSKSLELFRSAMLLRRQGKISSVFTNNGAVYIRKSAEESPVVFTADTLVSNLRSEVLN